jgi:hypothetical protein
MSRRRMVEGVATGADDSDDVPDHGIKVLQDL